jgi:hypothetical protein
VEARLRAASPTATAAALPEEEEPAPIKLSTVDEPMELERPFESRPTQVGAAPTPAEIRASTIPVAVSQVQEDFELERPHEAPKVSLKPPPPEPDPTATIRMPHPPPDEIVEFDEAPTMPGTLPGAALEVEFEEVTPPPPKPVPAEEPAAAVEPEPASEEIASVTLADLYLRQGFKDKAAEVLDQLLAREPGNERAQTRLREIHTSAAASPSPAPEDSGTDARRVVIQRTIDRLEAMLAAVRKA